MRLLLSIAAASFAFAAMGRADVLTWDFPINVDQEVPAPMIPAGAPTPSGVGNVTLDTDTLAISWTIQYENLTGDIVAPGAHFHGPADFGDTAGIQLFLTDGVPPSPMTGMLAGSDVITQDQADDLVAGLWYVNIHTEANQAGEIRGQVVPEPSAALALGLLASSVALRRRR